MQGHESSITTFPDHPSFDHSSSASSDAAIQQQIPRNQSGETNPQLMTLHHSFGEPSSSGGQGHVSKGAFRPYEPSNCNDGIHPRANGKQTVQEADELEVELIDSRDLFSGSSMARSELGGSFDGSGPSCKRKAVAETHMGPSSAAASSSFYHRNDAGKNIITPTETEIDAGSNNSRPRYGVADESSLSTGSLRNVRPRVDNVPEGTTLNRAVVERVDASSSVFRDQNAIPAVETGGGSSQEPSNGGSSYRRDSGGNIRSYIERIEMARRALLSALNGDDEGHGDGGNRVTVQGSSSLQETSQRNPEDYSEIPHPLRSLFASAEGRGGLMSEQIRQIFDLMRSGEGLRFEEVMLGNSFVFEMADLNDRHRDMRMDVDDMSYEELLELGEQIGNVCTGLKEGTISSHMKQHKFAAETQPKKIEAEEPCSICREEYVEGEAIGTLDCGHDFHTDCVKKWLMLKNLCPVCKTTGLNLPG